MNLPTKEDVTRMMNAERQALDAAKSAMMEFENYVSTMSPEARAEMNPENEEVIRYVEMRDRASAARVHFETLRSERASAEPMLRYQEFMQRQKDAIDIPLVQARFRMAEINYLNALMGEYEAMSVMMVQGPQALEQYDQASQAVEKWRAEYQSAREAFSKSPEGMLNPMSMSAMDMVLERESEALDEKQKTLKDFDEE